MLKQISIATCLASSLAFVGCATTTNPSTEKNLNKLQDTNWVLQEINGVKIDSQTPANLPSIQFTAANVSGSDGCNRFTGGYAVKAKEIKLSQMASTAMACLSATDLPNKFNDSLSKVTHYEATKSDLQLIDANKNTLLKFVPAVEKK